MKWAIWLCAGWLGGVSCVLGAEAYEIKGVRRTAGTQRGNVQSVGRMETRATEQSVYYEFSFRRLQAASPEQVTARWLLLLEASGGAVLPAVHARETVQLPLGQIVKVETEPVTLLGREFQGRRTGQVADQIAGYAVRLLDENGVVVAEKYEPKSQQRALEQALVEAERPKLPRAPDAPKPPLPPGGWPLRRPRPRR
ncbi:MAG: hypothetical protein K9N49_00730 [Candidatus Marinimicrobia bacterium]|nr:hypothetical protein [Candidatus Neomarinimicrobiota bacterium]